MAGVFQLSLRLLWRSSKGGELKILLTALLMAVVVVSAVLVFTARLDKTLVAQSSEFLGADRIVKSSQDIPLSFEKLARENNVKQGKIVQFSSMVFAGHSEDYMSLATVKAVTENYPLLGKIEISRVPFGSGGDVLSVTHGPKQGEAWVDSRLLPLIDVKMGETIQIGEADFTISHVVIREPDRGDGFSAFGPRVLIHYSDLSRTGVVQPGSRVKYQWLLAAPSEVLDPFIVQLKPLLNEHQSLVDLASAQRGLARAIERGQQFLTLATIISVLLSGIAAAIAAQRYAERQVDAVALMKTLGAGVGKIRTMFSWQLLFLWLLAAALGSGIAFFIQQIMASFVEARFDLSLSSVGISAYFFAPLTALLSLLCFALPPLWYLPEIPPVKVLRSELGLRQVSTLVQLFVGILGLLVLILVISGNWSMTLGVLAGMAVVSVLIALMAFVGLKLGKRVGMEAGSVWRLAAASLTRKPSQTITQVVVFSTAFMVLFSLYVLRTSLLEQWQMQLPEDTPNHFFINIADHELETVSEIFTTAKVDSETPLYPMVRGRLSEINDQRHSEALRKKVAVLNREANLSWSATLADDNEVIAGQWWDSWETEKGIAGVSVESELAERLGLSLGDKLTFSIGGLPLEAEVASFRTLQWDSMRPNFYFLLSPGALDDFSPMYITSVFLEGRQKPVINNILREFPTIVVLEMDRVIEQVRTIVDQVSRGVEWVMWLIISGGALVLVAAVSASVDFRKREIGLLRALGCSRERLLGSIWIEFLFMGLVAGIIATIGAEVLLLSLQARLFDIPLVPHYGLWLVGPLITCLLLGLLGWLSCRGLVNISPVTVLREAR